MKQSRPCQYPDCGLSKNASRHYGPSADHEYVGERKAGFGQQRQPLKHQSDRPNRVERREQTAQVKAERRATYRSCEAPAHGIQSPCGTGLEARLEASHVYGLGMGGGKEHGEVRMLCVKHHRELDTDRQTFREAGLSLRPPTSATPHREAAPAPSQEPERPKPWSRWS